MEELWASVVNRVEQAEAWTLSGRIKVWEMKPEAFLYIVNNWRSLLCNSMTSSLSLIHMHSFTHSKSVSWAALCVRRHFSKQLRHCSKALDVSYQNQGCRNGSDFQVLWPCRRPWYIDHKLRHLTQFSCWVSLLEIRRHLFLDCVCIPSHFSCACCFQHLGNNSSCGRGKKWQETFPYTTD